MSIPDGEYDIDLSILEQEPNNDTFGVRFGAVPSNLDPRKPMKLYDDTKNLILEVHQTENNDGPLIFEGVGQVHNSKNPVMSNYYLAMENNRFKLGKLSRTIRVNKSRNNIKWSGLIRKWNNELESRGIINESDFDNLDDGMADFEMEFEENELEIELEKAQEKREEAKREEREGEKGEGNETVSKKEAANESKKELKPPIEIRHQTPETPQTSQPRPAQNTSKPQQQPSKDTSSAPSKVQQTAGGPSRARVAGKKVASKSVPRPSKSSKTAGTGTRPAGTVATKRVASKKPPEEDEFKDLEDQLAEMLEDSDDSESEFSDVISGPITVIESKPAASNTTRTTSQPSGRRPMSLRALMGDKGTDDFSSSEEE